MCGQWHFSEEILHSLSFSERESLLKDGGRMGGREEEEKASVSLVHSRFMGFRVCSQLLRARKQAKCKRPG